MVYQNILSINDSKTEWLTFDDDPNNSSWKQSRQLGTLLDEEEDLARRMALASSAFKSMYPSFVRRSHICLSRRLRIYNAFVLPVLLYNCGTWALTKVQAEKLSAFHRRQLRSILGVRWPETISNDTLYRRTGQCDIADMVEKARVRLLGHCLRMDIQSPPQRALEIFSDPARRRRRGRPKTTIGQYYHRQFNLDASSLKSLREEASDRLVWRRKIRP